MSIHIWRIRQDRLAAWFPVLLLALLAGLVYWLNNQVQQASLPPKERSTSPDYFLENFTGSKFGEDGKLRQVLTAGRLLHFFEQDLTQIDSPRYQLTEPERPAFTISAAQSLVKGDGKDIYFYRQVKAVQAGRTANNGPTTLTTEYLHVVPELERASTDRAIFIESSQAQVRAVGMTLNNKTGEIMLHDQVEGIILRKK